MWMRNVFTKTLGDLRWATFWVGLALFVGGGYFTLLYPTYSKMIDLEQILSKLPPAMKALIGGQLIDVSTPTGFLNVELFPLMLPAVLGGYAIALGSGAVASEEGGGTIDVILSYPVSRVRLLCQKGLAMVISVSVVSAALLVGAVGGAALSRSELDAGHVAAGLVMATLFALDFGALGLLVSTWTGSRATGAGITAAALVVMYFVNALAPIIEGLDAVKELSLFYWYLEGNPLRNGLVVGDTLVLAAVALALFGLSLVAFERRDLT
jgi:ABC-2 type transport system permease protein